MGPCGWFQRTNLGGVRGKLVSHGVCALVEGALPLRRGTLCPVPLLPEALLCACSLLFFVIVRGSCSSLCFLPRASQTPNSVTTFAVTGNAEARAAKGLCFPNAHPRSPLFDQNGGELLPRPDVTQPLPHDTRRGKPPITPSRARVTPCPPPGPTAHEGGGYLSSIEHVVSYSIFKK